MKNNKSFLIGTVVVAVLIFAGLAFWNSNSKQTPNEYGGSSDHLIKSHNLVQGNPQAKVTIVEFLDPECEACRSMHPIVKNLMSEYEGKIKLVIRYMPFHGNSRLAAVMLEEAREQGKFDEAINILFDKQPQWADHAAPRPELIPEFLVQVGVDKSKLQVSELMTKHGWKIDEDEKDGTIAGVRFTPTFFVNGKMLSEIGYAPIKQAIEAALAN